MLFSFGQKSFFASVLLLGGAVHAQGAAIGEAKKVVPAAFSEGETGNRTLAIGASLFPNDLVKTGGTGQTGIEFLDRTFLEVGPSSSLKLDKGIFNPDKTAAEAVISLTSGIFRYVSGGISRPNTYTIVTPHVTMGIRGTKIEGIVQPSGTQFVVTEGTVEACSLSGGGCYSLSPGTPANGATFNGSGGVQTYASLGLNPTVLARAFGDATANDASGGSSAGRGGGGAGSSGTVPGSSSPPPGPVGEPPGTG